MLEDGSDYGVIGMVEFVEVLVNIEIGIVMLCVCFFNLQGLLFFGMFVQVKFVQVINQCVFLVLQVGVLCDVKGNVMVYVVIVDNKVVQKKVKVDCIQGVFWVVISGLEVGDKIVMQGLLKIVLNQSVKLVFENVVQWIEVFSDDFLGGVFSQKKVG